MRFDMSFNRRRFQIAAAAAMAFCGLSSAARAQTAINLSTAITNSGVGTVTTSTPLGINSYDQVVGYYSTSAGQQAFVYTPSSGAVTLPDGTAGFNNKAWGINDSGEVAGTYGGNGTTESFYYNTSIGASSFTQILPVADGSGSTTYHGAFIEAQAINNNNVITGYSSVSNTSSPSSDRTFAYTIPSGTATDVSSPYVGTAVGEAGAYGTFGYAINGSGVIANYGALSSTAASNNTKTPFILTPNGSGGYTGTSLAGAIAAVDPSYVSGNNNGFEGVDALGNVVGDYTEGSGTSFGFFYNGSTGAATEISNTFGTGAVKIYGISDVGTTPEFVGSEVISGGTTHAFVDYGGTAYDLNTIDPVAGYILTVAYAINGNGDIVATGTPTAGGSAQAFLLTNSAVPEPASLGLLSMGALALLTRRRGRRIA